MPLKPITKMRLSEAAIEQIKELIVSENLEPGSQLPSERHLVEALGVGDHPSARPCEFWKSWDWWK